MTIEASDPLYGQTPTWSPSRPRLRPLRLLLAWVYAAMRPRYGAGAKTALRAALAVWLPLHVVGTGYQVELGMTTLREGAILSGAALIMVCVAALIAGWIYREGSASSRAAGA